MKKAIRKILGANRSVPAVRVIGTLRNNKKGYGDCFQFHKPFIYNGAEGRTRTGTIRDRLILSQVRLPIPPLRHKILILQAFLGF